MPATPAISVASFLLKPALPEILTDKDWDKKKGVFAKIAGKTGIGEVLKKLKTEFDKADFTKFQAKLLIQGAVDWEKYNKAFEAAKSEHTKVMAAQKAFYAVRDLAKTTAEKFKKNPLIHKDSTAHATNLADTADWYGLMMNSLDEEFKDKKKDFERLVLIARNELPGSMKRIDEYIQKTLDNPNVKFYTEKDSAKFSLHQIVRGISAAIAIQPEEEFTKLSPEWTRMSSAPFMKGVKDGDQVKAKVEEIKKALPTMKKVVADKVK